jgi:hypothetical protein
MPAIEPSRASAYVDSVARGHDRAWAAGAFGLVAVSLFAVAAGSAAWLPLGHRRSEIQTRDWLGAWAHFDGRWYLRIAQDGYGFGHHRVSFFPVYALAIRAVTSLGISFVAAGVGITLVSGLLAVVLFREWLADHMSPANARITVVALLLFPFGLFLVGAVYADALFLLLTLGAFVAAERGRLLLAVGLGVFATASRPVGVAVAVGLIALVWERTREQHLTVRTRSVGLASITISGFVAYCVYLTVRFGNPLAFAANESHWHQSPGLTTFLKIPMFEELFRWGWSWRSFSLLLHPIVAIAALALVPKVFRRFGRPYGLYTLVVLLIPVVFTKDFFGMGRYVLAAFPCFAIVGERLAAARSTTRNAILIGSGIGLVVLTSAFARGAYVS